MLLSLSLIILLGLLSAYLSEKIKIPKIIGYLLTGIIIGPYALNLLGDHILMISADIRQMALVIILTRAGLGLDLTGLIKNGRPAFLMSFMPAIFEILGIAILAPLIFGINFMEALIIGAVLAAVSPAIVVPRMTELLEKGYGVQKGIPQVILAGASVDDIFVILLFSTFLNLFMGQSVSLLSVLNLPLSIILGILIGWLVGKWLAKLFSIVEVKQIPQFLIILSLSFALVSIENQLNTPITFSALIAVMCMGISIQKHARQSTAHLTKIYRNIWSIAEIFLFVLVGSLVNISYLSDVTFWGIILIAWGLLFRMCGVWCSLIGTNFNRQERFYTMIAYMPKATVQAAIAGIPLSFGLEIGGLVLSIAVLAIIITAPLGAFFMDHTYQKWLKKEKK